MSLKTLIRNADWVATTFDGQEIYLTQDEYDLYSRVCNTEVKVLTFDDGSLAIADIRRVAPVFYAPQNAGGLEAGDEDAAFKLKNSEAYAKFKTQMEAKFGSIKKG